jgi:1-acyl-sn-glycerol-3-phosphate acyltransferase
VRQYFFSDFLVLAKKSDSLTADFFMEKVTFLYYLVRELCYWIFRIFWRLRIFNLNKIPRKGPLIVCANHRSYADPPLMGVTVNRPVCFLAKEELFSFKPFGWFIYQLNARPLNRSGDVGAFKTALRVLENNGVMIIFPEGGRSKTDQFRQPKAGVGLLAKKSGAKIVPAYIHNSNRWLKGASLKVIFGDPIDPRPFETYQQVGHVVMEKIKGLKDELDQILK